MNMIVDENLDKFQRMRRERIKLIGEILKAKQQVDRKSFLASMSVEFGIRRKTLLEYLRDLETLGKIKVTNEKIRWLENE